MKSVVGCLVIIINVLTETQIETQSTARILLETIRDHHLTHIKSVQCPDRKRQGLQRRVRRSLRKGNDMLSRAQR